MESSLKILITGASGFIGAHLVEEALSRDLEVYAGVRSTSSLIRLQDNRIRFFHVDFSKKARLLTDLQEFQQSHGGFQYVIHNAGVMKPRSAAEFYIGNAEFTRDFAQILAETQKNFHKFIYISSVAALGPGDPSTLAPIREDKIPTPITPYGSSKLAAEKYLMQITGLPYNIIRPTAVYGPHDRKFILRIIGMLKNGIEVRLGPSRQALSFIHVDDLSRVVVDACLAEVTREAFLISDGDCYNQREFNKVVKDELDGIQTVGFRIPAAVLMGAGYIGYLWARLLQKPLHLSHFKMREITARNWNVDISKAKTTLSFAPEFDLRSGIKHVLAKA